MAFDYSRIAVAVGNIVEALSPKAIILFGSVAGGTAGDDSDIDLIVIMEADMGPVQRSAAARVAVGSIGVPVDVLVYTPGELDGEKPLILREALEHGKVLYGTIRRHVGSRRPHSSQNIRCQARQCVISPGSGIRTSIRLFRGFFQHPGFGPQCRRGQRIIRDIMPL